MNSIITVDLGFGDAGKGATVDYLVRQHQSPLVVRYNGGCQAAHHVQLPDGRRHCFSQFGAGTLAGAETFLGPEVIIDVSGFATEAKALTETFGFKNPYAFVTLHPNCLVSTPFHKAYNRIIDKMTQHGSCGMGIGITRKYGLDYGVEAIFARDLFDVDILAEKLRLLKARLRGKLEVLLGQPTTKHYDSHMYEVLRNLSVANTARLMVNAWSKFTGLRISKAPEWPEKGTVIFEGAQGVLLDQSMGFHPHTTWSDITTKPALEILHRKESLPNYQVLGITRAYTTRHGNGPAPSTKIKKPGVYGIIGNYAEGNDEIGSFQGYMRAGPLDMHLLDYAIDTIKPDKMAVTCLDHLKEDTYICRAYSTKGLLKWDPFQVPTWTLQGQQVLTGLLNNSNPIFHRITRQELVERLNEKCQLHSVSYGPTHQDRKGF